MLFYSKEAALLVYDQVNRDNPDLPSPLTPSNSIITKAAAAVSSNGRNTRATFTRLPAPRLPKYSLTDPNNAKGTQSELTGAEFEMFKMLVNDTWAADVLFPNVYVMTATSAIQRINYTTPAQQGCYFPVFELVLP